MQRYAKCKLIVPLTQSPCGITLSPSRSLTVGLCYANTATPDFKFLSGWEGLWRFDTDRSSLAMPGPLKVFSKMMDGKQPQPSARLFVWPFTLFTAPRCLLYYNLTPLSLTEPVHTEHFNKTQLGVDFRATLVYFSVLMSIRFKSVYTQKCVTQEVISELE